MPYPKGKIFKRTTTCLHAAIRAYNFKEVFLTSALLILVSMPSNHAVLLPSAASAAPAPRPALLADWCPQIRAYAGANLLGTSTDFLEASISLYVKKSSTERPSSQL